MKHVEQIDLHVVALVVVLLPLSVALAREIGAVWPCLIVPLFPQGMLVMRFLDERQAGERRDAWQYLIVNELMLAVAFSVAAGVAWGWRHGA